MPQFTRLQNRNQSGSCYKIHMKEQMGWDCTQLTSHVFFVALDGPVYGLVILYPHHPWMKRAPREPASVTLGRAPGAKGAHMAGTSVSTNSKILIQLKTPTPLPSPTRHLLLSLIPLNLQTGRRAGQDQLPTADSLEQALWSHHYQPITSKGNLKKRPNSIFLLLYSSL